MTELTRIHLEKDMSIIEQEVSLFASRYMNLYTNNTYHNYNHALAVVKRADQLGEALDVDKYERYLLRLAGHCHDLVWYKNIEEHKLTAEEESARIAASVLPLLGVDYVDAFLVADIIRATDLKTEPKGQLEKIIRDADVGGEDIPGRVEPIRSELGLTKFQMHNLSIKFLENLKWYTKPAEELWDMYRLEGIRYSKLMLEKYV